ncbi:MAG: hypothetical protein KBD06_05305 [Candidatus Pacebacteria bacterium]|nr:hypothetical protein [Candidatus Paceibacterota bacterium]
MRAKGSTFVRTPGLTVRESAHLKEKPMQQMHAEQPEDRAKARLGEYHQAMLGLWGPNYEGDPRYQSALGDVRKGRHPALVLDDFRTAF